MKHRILFFLLLISFTGHAQNIDSLEIHVIQKTLPAYLNKNPNSIVSYFKGGEGYDMLSFVWKNALNNETDSLKRVEIEKELRYLDFVSDSIQNALKNQKIEVKVSDTIHTYEYVPRGDFDLRNPEHWEIEYKYLKEDFTENRLVRLDTTISVEFIDLIKQQIEIEPKRKEFLPLKKLNESYYEYISSQSECREKKLCFDAGKLFRPVFNQQKNKGCYLFSHECRNGTCRDFIFIEKREGKWVFVESYASHLIGYEE